MPIAYRNRRSVRTLLALIRPEIGATCPKPCRRQLLPFDYERITRPKSWQRLRTMAAIPAKDATAAAHGNLMTTRMN